MNDDDCTEIASKANIQLMSIADIFYDNRFQFTAENDNSYRNYLYDRNHEAAEVLKKAFD